VAKPLIGITVESKFDPNDARSRGNIQLNWNYFERVAEAGGNPIVITPRTDVAELAPLLDGWLIPGGMDIDATRFGQENHPAAELQDPSRFETEIALFRAVPDDLPIFGICYGCQFLNVARGGDLIQHLPDVTETAHTGGVMQAYRIEPESKVGGITSRAEIEGKSYHHQAIDRVGAGLRVVGRGEDGTIEAIEATDRPWLIGLQWHPERTPDDEATRRMFDDFVRAAAEFRSRK